MPTLEIAPPIDVAVLAYPTVFASAVVGVVDALEVANAVAANLTGNTAARRFKPRIVAAAPGWKTLSPGVRVRAGALGTRRPDVLFVPPSMRQNVRALFDGAIDLAAEHRMIHRAHAGGALIATHCVGVVVTAASGLLDDRRATTSWWLGQGMRRRFPRVRLALDRMIVEDGGVLTAGPATAQFDLYVRLVQRYMGDTLAAFCAQLWATEPGREFQGAYARQTEADRVTDALVVKAIDYAARHLGEVLTLADLASAAATSSRTLIRHFHASVGDSPLGYLQRMRVDRAKAIAGRVEPEPRAHRRAHRLPGHQLVPAAVPHHDRRHARRLPAAIPAQVGAAGSPCGVSSRPDRPPARDRSCSSACACRRSARGQRAQSRPPAIRPRPGAPRRRWRPPDAGRRRNAPAWS